MRIAIAGGTGVVGGYAADAAEAAGHDVVVLTRHSGVDVARGEGLSAALEGVEVVIDTLNLLTLKGSATKEFFVTTSRNLQDAAARQGVAHLVSLSIVGIDRAPSYPYYQAKLAQEATVTKGKVPVTILRATQFHEFPVQMMRWLRRGRLAFVPRLRSQPVAARTVGEHLIRLATERPGGTIELAGPEVHDIADLARRYAAAHEPQIRVIGLPVPGKYGRQVRAGALLATDGATIDGPTFDQWLSSDDAKRIGR
ncbi:MAG: hypothetical protein QOG34_463 [Frankiaceae bacterium]|nr:hypothetical protein [Frankiaceae bacterium]